MNQTQSVYHLSYDDLLKALTDRSDLNDEQAHHLNQCPACQKALEQISYRFHRMGKMAAELAPTPTTAVRIPDGASSSARRRASAIRNASAMRRTTTRRGGRSLWAVAATAAMILLFMNVWPRYRPDTPLTQGLAGTPSPPVTLTPQALLSDRNLMQEVNVLVDNALPTTVRQLASVTTPRFDEDLINWIVPSIQGDGESENEKESLL